MRPLLQIVDLSYQYPDGTPALRGINLSLADGESLALLGPNGSGKTTLLLHLNGTLMGSGTIRIAGLDVCKSNLKEIRRQVGIVFQDSDEQLFMPTVLEDVMFGPLNLGWTREMAEHRARAVLEQVGLSGGDAQRPPFHLSAGEKRRVALAGVLAMEPKLLVLDEPTTSLDPPGQRALLELLKQLPQPKLIATHDVSFATGLATRAVFLTGGRIEAEGPLPRIVEQFDWQPN
jgi:energy-coupling factor transporter ATP-binding protein EcfA2